MTVAKCHCGGLLCLSPSSPLLPACMGESLNGQKTKGGKITEGEIGITSGFEPERLFDRYRNFGCFPSQFASFSLSHHHVRLRPRRCRPRRQRSPTTHAPRRPTMNVSALLQESPSGDLRNRQQAQKQQQQQQLQRQLTPQPQQTHDRRTSFDSARDHDLKDREREREPDPHRNRASSILSRQQIDLSFPISNSMPKLNQQSHGPGLGIGYPNDHQSSRAPHQLPPPSSLTGDLPDPGTRLPPPRCVFAFAFLRLSSRPCPWHPAHRHNPVREAVMHSDPERC